MEVKAGQDDDADNDSVTLTHVASGGGYSVTSGMVTVTITDDDQAKKGVIVTPTAFNCDRGRSVGKVYGRPGLGTHRHGDDNVGWLGGREDTVFGRESHVPDVQSGQLEQTAAGDGDGRRGRRRNGPPSEPSS